MNELSDRAKQLILKARIMSFDGWAELTPEAIRRLQAADDESRYLTDEDLTIISSAISTGNSTGLDTVTVVKQLRDQAADIVDEARGGVLTAFPGILETGGGLYPPMRAAACWRDFWQFLRCITYGIAGQHDDYTSPNGLVAMEQLYEELQVPLPAMIKGLQGIKQASLNRLPRETQASLAPYFDHLIDRLSRFSN